MLDKSFIIFSRQEFMPDYGDFLKKMPYRVFFLKNTIARLFTRKNDSNNFLAGCAIFWHSL